MGVIEYNGGDRVRYRTEFVRQEVDEQRQPAALARRGTIQSQGCDRVFAGRMSLVLVRWDDDPSGSVWVSRGAIEKVDSAGTARIYPGVQVRFTESFGFWWRKEFLEWREDTRGVVLDGPVEGSPGCVFVEWQLRTRDAVFPVHIDLLERAEEP